MSSVAGSAKAAKSRGHARLGTYQTCSSPRFMTLNRSPGSLDATLPCPGCDLARFVDDEDREATAPQTAHCPALSGAVSKMAPRTGTWTDSGPEPREELALFQSNETTTDGD